MLFAAVLTSCGTNLSVFQKGPPVLSPEKAREVAKHGSSSGQGSLALASFGAIQPNSPLHAPATPSAAVLSAANRAAKDKHGMPVYAFSERTRLVRTTAYNPIEADHLQYGANNAAGTSLRFDSRMRSAAADWSVYPLGTVFKIKGHPYLYVVDDYGSALVGTQTVDLFMPNPAYMQAWGSRKVELTVLRWGSLNQSAEMLAKRTNYSHCRQMFSSIAGRASGKAAASM
jgi:3D (Asp-Asp-Asp) domain-containing protein